MDIDNDELISAILARPALWNSNSPHHRHKRTVNKYWEEIEDLLGNVEVCVLKKRWKNLKDQYRKELKKNDFQSPWQYFQQMDFLRFEVLPNEENKSWTIKCNDDIETTANVKSPHSIDMSSRDDTYDIDNLNTSTPPVLTSSSTQPSSDRNPPPTVTKSEVQPRRRDDTSLASSSNSRPQKRKVIDEYREETFEIEKKWIALLEKDIQQQNIADTKANECKSSDYYYLMSLLPHMEHFTSIQKFRVRNKFNQIMLEELTILQNGKVAKT